MNFTGRLPNFIIAGVAKSATSSLYHYLRQHPQITFGQVRTPNYFGLGDQPVEQYGGPVSEHRACATTEADMRGLYRGAEHAIAVGDGSSFFNFTPRAAQRLWKHVPEAKIIFLLRDPVQRLYSQYRYARAMGWEPASRYRDALRQEPRRVRENWFPFLRYRASCKYAEALHAYYQLFPCGQIFVASFENLRDAPAELMRRLCDFLGVDASFTPRIDVNHNPTQVPEFPWFYSRHNVWAAHLRRIVPTKIQAQALSMLRRFDLRAPDRPDEILKFVGAEEFREDILETQSMTGLDCSGWLRRVDAMAKPV